MLLILILIRFPVLSPIPSSLTDGSTGYRSGTEVGSEVDWLRGLSSVAPSLAGSQSLGVHLWFYSVFCPN